MTDASIDLKLNAGGCSVGQSATIFFAGADGETKNSTPVFVPAGSNGVVRVELSGADTESDFSVRVSAAGNTLSSAWFDTLAVSSAFSGGGEVTEVEGTLCESNTSLLTWVVSFLFLTILLLLAVMLLVGAYRTIRGARGPKGVESFPTTSIFPN